MQKLQIGQLVKTPDKQIGEIVSFHIWKGAELANVATPKSNHRTYGKFQTYYVANLKPVRHE